MDDLFTSIVYVEDLMLIIKEWLKDHPQDKKVANAREIYDKLDILRMNW